MTAEQFAYWLQGFAEIRGEAPTRDEWKIIQDHLQTVFIKITPDRSRMPQYVPNMIPPFDMDTRITC